MAIAGLRARLAALFVAALIGLAGAALAQGSTKEGRAAGEGPVWVAPVTGTIDLGLAAFIQRTAAEAVAAGASVLILELNTFGGRVDAATEIRDALDRADFMTVAFVRERAWSAGALIALAADRIYMAPGATMGAAEPRPADPKSISAIRAEFEAMAERRGRRPDIAAAMVDQRVSVEGLSAEGELLTLTAAQAREYGYAEGIVAGREALLAELGLSGREVYIAQANWAERLARFLSDPLVSQLLLTVGFLGLLAEVSSPGLGAGALISLLALFLFFGARTFLGLVGWEVIGLFVLGLALLLLELFVVAGFGVVGLTGVGAILASLFLSFADAPSALRALGVAAAASAVGGLVLWRLGRRVGAWRGLILAERLSSGAGDAPEVAAEKYRGKRGRSLTPLRPSGTVMIDGERVDAVSEGGYIGLGREVVVIRVDGPRVVVREVSE